MKCEYETYPSFRTVTFSVTLCDHEWLSDTSSTKANYRKLSCRISHPPKPHPYASPNTRGYRVKAVRAQSVPIPSSLSWTERYKKSAPLIRRHSRLSYKLSWMNEWNEMKWMKSFVMHYKPFQPLTTLRETVRVIIMKVTE